MSLPSVMILVLAAIVVAGYFRRVRQLAREFDGQQKIKDDLYLSNCKLRAACLDVVAMGEAILPIAIYGSGEYYQQIHQRIREVVTTAEAALKTEEADA